MHDLVRIDPDTEIRTDELKSGIIVTIVCHSLNLTVRSD